MFKVSIDVGNAAFAECMHSEVARILRELADKVESGPPSGRALDANGNVVGEYGFHSPYEENDE